MALGGLMIWAGWQQATLLATVLLVFGIGIVLFAAVGLLFFPRSFRELSAVRQWQAWSHPGVVWISGNPHPSICSPDDRLDLGLPDEQPPWCVYFRSRPGAAVFPDGDPARRQEIRERLRERLRALPRGLQEEDPQ